jgi:uncharacterized protein (TIGR02145 family)
MKRKSPGIAMSLVVSILLLSCSEKESEPWNAEIICSETLRSSFVDERDGQSYNTTTIGNQVWMAENLNYSTEDSYCYNDEESNCEEYGRLYEWASADTACPAAWHLPSTTEWEELLDNLEGEEFAGGHLKSTSGWKWDMNGTDDCGFSALASGIDDWSDGFDLMGEATEWWASDRPEDDPDEFIYSYWVHYTSNRVEGNFTSSSRWRRSVRCIMD